ncbi:MAG: hypothetical protein ACE5G3_13360 [Gammaproteobacteria bacterium]
MTEKRPGETLTADEKAFAERAGARLRESAGDLDAATLSRLNRARQRALDELPVGSGAGIGRWLQPAAMVGITAIAAIVVIGLWRMDESPNGAAGPVPVTAEEITDFELMLDDGDLEMIEDLEFFVWLAAENLVETG